MDVIALQSGSNGNCFYVEVDDVRLLFDAGIGSRTARQRLAQYNRDIRQVAALFISHEHQDHARSMGSFQRSYDIPLYITRSTLRATGQSLQAAAHKRVHHFAAGESIRIADVTVHTIATPHDGVDSVAFIVEHDEVRLGILTDLGHVFGALRDVLLSLDAVIIESNYDERMLKAGPYPEHLKRRIRGSGGHISNDDAADLIARTACFKRLQWACLCHLSAENNSPEIALRTVRAAVGKHFPLYVASRFGATEVMQVRSAIPQNRSSA